MLELKPCPFCGGPGRIVQANAYVSEQLDRPIFVEEYRAQCPKCGGSTGRVYKSCFVRKDGEIIFERDGYAEAVDGWNRRAETTPSGGAPDPIDPIDRNADAIGKTLIEVLSSEEN